MFTGRAAATLVSSLCHDDSERPVSRQTEIPTLRSACLVCLGLTIKFRFRAIFRKLNLSGALIHGVEAVPCIRIASDKQPSTSSVDSLPLTLFYLCLHLCPLLQTRQHLFLQLLMVIMGSNKRAGVDVVRSCANTTRCNIDSVRSAVRPSSNGLACAIQDCEGRGYNQSGRLSGRY